MRVLGLDYGTKTVGVALSDALRITAQPLETIFRKEDNKLRKTYARIEAICAENEVGLIVVGLPKNMNNTEGERASAAREFAANVARRTGLEVVMQDERLSTVEAERTLMECGVRREHRKEHIDAVAAALILEVYLSEHNDQEQMERIDGRE